MKFTAESTVFNDAKVQEKFSELTVDADGIRTEVGKKVGNSEIISKINQSAETVKIQASKVEVDGTLIIGKSQADAAYDSKGSAATAAQTASKYITADSTSGIKVHAEANPTTNYAQIDDTGMSIYQGVDGVATEVAAFKASGARIGQSGKANINVEPDLVTLNDPDGEVALYLSYDTIATRDEYRYGVFVKDENDLSYIGVFPETDSGTFTGYLMLDLLMENYIFKTPSQYYAVFADQGFMYMDKYDKLLASVDSSGNIHGEGNVSAGGNISAVGGYSDIVEYEDVTVSVTYAAGTIGSRGANLSLGSTVKNGYTYIGAFITDHKNTSAFNATILGSDVNGNAHLCAYRATGNAVSDASVTVRKVWLKTGTAQ